MNNWRLFHGQGFLKLDILSVKDMVTKVGLCCIGGFKIGKLWIAGHGAVNGQYIGADWVTADNIKQFQPELGRLTSLFDQRAAPPPTVTMCGCEVGRAAQFLLALQSILQVRVRGFTDLQYPIEPGSTIPPGFRGRQELMEPIRPAAAWVGRSR